MERTEVASKNLLYYIAAPFIALLFGYVYVNAMGMGYRMAIFINGAVLFFAGCAVFIKDLRSFLLFAMIMTIPLGLGRHLIYEPAQAGSVPFASGIAIDSVDVILLMLYIQWVITGSQRKEGRDGLTMGGAIGPLLLTWITYLLVLSLTVSHLFSYSIYEVYATSKGFLLFFYIANNIRDYKDLKITVWALFGTTLSQAFYLIFQYITKTSFTIHGQELQTTDIIVGFRAKGFFGAPDAHAAMMMTIFPVFLCTFLVSKKRNLKSFALFSMLSILLGIVCTRIRIAFAVGIVSSIIVIAVSLARDRITSRKAAFISIGGLVLALALSPLVAERFITGVYLEDRIPLMHTAINAISQNSVFGIGPNNYHTRVLDFIPHEFVGTWVYTVHNEYLLQAAETGIIGVLIYYSVLCIVLIRIFRLTRSADLSTFTVATGLFAALGASIVHRMLSMYFSQPVFSDDMSHFRADCRFGTFGGWASNLERTIQNTLDGV